MNKKYVCWNWIFFDILFSYFMIKLLTLVHPIAKLLIILQYLRLIEENNLSSDARKINLCVCVVSGGKWIIWFSESFTGDEKRVFEKLSMIMNLNSSGIFSCAKIPFTSNQLKGKPEYISISKSVKGFGLIFFLKISFMNIRYWYLEQHAKVKIKIS